MRCQCLTHALVYLDGGGGESFLQIIQTGPKLKVTTFSLESKFSITSFVKCLLITEMTQKMLIGKQFAGGDNQTSNSQIN